MSTDERQNEQQQEQDTAREVVKMRGDSYGEIVKRQFRKNRTAVWSLRVIIFLLIIALFADFIANDKPLVAKTQDRIVFPVAKDYLVSLGMASWPADLQNTDWKRLDYDFAIWPPVPYSADDFDMANSNYVGPFDAQEVEGFRWRHHFGTEQIGRDVLAGMVHGTRIAMMVGVVSMSIASIIGILFGALAGYFGDNRLKISWVRVLLNLVFLVPAIFYGFSVRSYAVSDALARSFGAGIAQVVLSVLIFTGVMAVPNLLAMGLKRVPGLGRRTSVPVDIIVSRIIEVLISIPKLLLILSIVAIAKPSLVLVMVIIGATSWTGIARFTRGELLKVRNLEYIEAANSLGYSEARTIFRHALPNALTPVLISIAFGVAGAILLESFLSFLGIGVPAETVTWGKLLSLSRKAPEAWWLAIFPGFAIFITVTVYNLLGEGLTDALDPRLKQ